MLEMLESLFNPLSKGSPISALAGDYGLLSNPDKTWDVFKNGKTNEINEKIAKQNLEFQKENQDYNRALNEEIFNRADTAHQREVEDLRKAGLNPLINTSGNEIGNATPTETIKNEYQHQDIGNLSAFNSISDLINQLQNFQIGIDYGREQKAKADSATAQATVDKQTALDKINMSHLDKWTKNLLFKDLMRENEYNSYFSINKGMSEEERTSRILANLLRDEDNTGYGYAESIYEEDGEYITPAYTNSIREEAYKNLVIGLLANKGAEAITNLISGIDLNPVKINNKLNNKTKTKK